jgi:hypothetical protein
MRNDWPPHAAFVLQFGASTDLRTWHMEGRVEHIASLRWARFGSLEELLSFLHEAMASATAPGPEENRES